MSGSGSSLFTLYDDQIAAQTAAQATQKQFSISALAVPIAPASTDDVAL
jgi:4-diphosphocytidyl-2C-methyl-D-erythritol kinase